MSETPRILELNPGHAFGLGQQMAGDNQINRTMVDQYALANVELQEYDVLLITDFIDQEYLFTHKRKIEAFLEAGNIVIFCGHLFRQWLPGCSPFMPKQIRSHKDYYMVINEPNGIFAGVEIEDMVYNKGVAGFFARGYHPAPKEAEVQLTFEDGKPITYVDRHSTNGTILVHAGRSLFQYSGQSKSTDRIGKQAWQWVVSECHQLKGEKVQ
ncbi:hypothetical protein [Bacillus massiliigorillae]|uniref:hypothetical protein n=1 Tax=Bacillus massiliigorillae TaxID=1243664 RepID=UPI0003AA7556|nr:hypothetical protein [Bacillus massiliigorillae]